MSLRGSRTGTYHGRTGVVTKGAASLEIDLILDKYLLFTPGPVNVAESLRTAICKEDICHREPDFDDLLAGIEHKSALTFSDQKARTLSRRSHHRFRHGGQ